MRKKRKKPIRMPSLSAYVIFSIAMLLVYTIAELILSSLNGQMNDTLTTCFFAVFGGEILTCALIKIYKLKENKDE